MHKTNVERQRTFELYKTLATNTKTFILLQGTSLKLVQDMRHSSEYRPPVLKDINDALFLECSKIKC